MQFGETLFMGCCSVVEYLFGECDTLGLIFSMGWQEEGGQDVSSLGPQA